MNARPTSSRRTPPSKVGGVSRGPNLHTAVRPVIERLERTEPSKRITMAFTLTEQLQDIQAEIAAQRRAAVRQLRADGWKLAQIAQAAGVTVSRVKQIEAGYGRRNGGDHEQ